MLIKPKSKAIWTNCSVSYQNIVRVCDPERRRSLINNEQTSSLFSLNSQIVFESVFCLYCILNEESMTHSFVSNIPLYSQVVDSVKSNSSIVWPVDCISSYVGVASLPIKMKMNRISSKLVSLPYIPEFTILNKSNNWSYAIWMYHELSSILLFLWGYWISSNYNVSWKETYFCSHFKFVLFEHLDTSIMLI